MIEAVAAGLAGGALVAGALRFLPAVQLRLWKQGAKEQRDRDRITIAGNERRLILIREAAESLRSDSRTPASVIPQVDRILSLTNQRSRTP